MISFRPERGVRSHSSSRRRGVVLTWFAVLLFALLPLMMLIVHLGMVTLTRRQMQTAVNTAALEGDATQRQHNSDDGRRASGIR